MSLRLIILRGLAGASTGMPPAASEGREPAQFHGATLAEAFLNATDRRPDHSAVITAAGTVSHEELRRAALEVSRALGAVAEFSPGDRVVMLLANSPLFPAAYYGVILAGGVAVPLPPDIESSRFARIIREGGIRTILAIDDAGLVRAGVAFTTTTLDLDQGRRRRDDVDGKPPASAHPADLAMILYTSGSTGQPKGVMLTHANILANARIICTHLPVGPGERALANSPFYHAFGNAVMQTHLLCGATLVIDGTLTFPKTLIDAIARHSVTMFSAVPEAWRFLVSRGALRAGGLPSLRYATTAGAPMPDELARRIAELIAPAQFFSLYGQTESTSRLSYIDAHDLAAHPGSIGRSAPGVEIEVVDDAGRRLAPGEIGEIRARGPNVMAGYWGDAATTSRVLCDGWLHTGDLGEVDQDGFISLRGRMDDIVKIGGIRLHPGEVEQLLRQRMPGVDVAAVAFQSEASEPRLAIFIRRGDAGGREEASIRDLCRRDLPRHMVPAVIELIEDFPLTGTMKLDRRALARRAEELAAASVTIPA